MDNFEFIGFTAKIQSQLTAKNSANMKNFKLQISNFKFLFFLAFFFLLAAHCSLFTVLAQIPQATMLKIVRAEDELRFDKDLEELLKSADAATRKRAALAAGRIGNEKAIGLLSELLEKDASAEVRMMAAFALGEIESGKGPDAVLKSLAKKNEPEAIRARAVEAAGKIAAATAQTDKEKSADLGEAILDALEAEHLKQTPNREVVLLGLTAALRAKPEETSVVVARYLTDRDARIRADALNTLVRLRAKSEDLKAQFRAMLLSDDDPVVRANAARALGASEDAQGLELLTEAATNDDDQRVRVAAIRSLAALKDKKAVEPLIARGEKLNVEINSAKGKSIREPAQKNELLEIASTVSRLLANSNDERAVKFFLRSRIMTYAPEVETGFARTTPAAYLDATLNHDIFKELQNPNSTVVWNWYSTFAQGFGEISNSKDESLKTKAAEKLRAVLSDLDLEKVKKRSYARDLYLAVPDVLRAYALFKRNDLREILLKHLNHSDVIVRATAAELLTELPASAENFKALRDAFTTALERDTESNDAQLAILSALVKLDKKESVASLQSALYSPDFLVRRHAANLIKQSGLEKDFPKLDEQVGTVRFISAGAHGINGMITAQNADYIRAISRKNGNSKAILTTEKGTFTIDLLPEDAPLTVDNFIKLAKSNYFNRVTVHRVVPNFVVQDGDPRGDGNGGPGWSIRCEINLIPYERGAVGMALSGKDTGGSQWFVTHSPQPHLDGGYTVFGRVNETDMKIVDSIARGDKILKVQINESGAAPRRKK